MKRRYIAAMKARCEAATEGPWEWKDGILCGKKVILQPLQYTYDEVVIDAYDYDEWFIANARTDLPECIAYIEYLENLLRQQGHTWIVPESMLDGDKEQS